MARLAATEHEVGRLNELRADLQQIKLVSSSLATQLDKTEKRQDDSKMGHAETTYSFRE